MASTTEICNFALSHLGIGKRISNVETDVTAEAKVCRIFFEPSRDKVLRDFPWPFATKILALGEIEESPNDEWGFSYRYPSDCLAFRRILSGTRNDTRQSQIPYRIAQDAAGKIIFTDREEAQGEYTVRTEDPAIYPPDFVLALSFLIAAYIAPAISAGDPFKLGARAAQFYEYEIDKAKANAANEVQPEEDVQSEFVRGRE